jgi:hypothetical protein
MAPALSESPMRRFMLADNMSKGLRALEVTVT